MPNYKEYNYWETIQLSLGNRLFVFSNSPIDVLKGAEQTESPKGGWRTRLGSVTTSRKHL